jgi:hypothetical protein
MHLSSLPDLQHKSLCYVYGLQAVYYGLLALLRNAAEKLGAVRLAALEVGKGYRPFEEKSLAHGVYRLRIPSISVIDLIREAEQESSGVE